jgi:hypothetical protein
VLPVVKSSWNLAVRGDGIALQKIGPRLCQKDDGLGCFYIVGRKRAVFLDPRASTTVAAPNGSDPCRRGRVHWNNLADDQVIKEHLDGGQMLLDRLRQPGCCSM